jgi:hypothetical protein
MERGLGFGKIFGWVLLVLPFNVEKCTLLLMSRMILLPNCGMERTLDVLSGGVWILEFSPCGRKC